MCVTPRRTAPAKNAKAAVAGTVPSWCPVGDWTVYRTQACRLEQVSLLHEVRICRNGTCKWYVVGLMNADIVNYIWTSASSELWHHRLEIRALDGQGTAVNGMVIEGQFDCSGSCFLTDSGEVPQQVLLPYGTATGETTFQNNVFGSGDREWGSSSVSFWYLVPTAGPGEGGDYSATAPQGVRCDSEIGNRPNGCVFPDAWPVFDLAHWFYPSVAEHVQAAWRSGIIGHDFPLTRITDPDEIDANRNTSCPSWIPRPPGYECDEYPFASTKEGADWFGDKAGRTFDWCQRDDLPRGVTGPYGWSACFVDKEDNRSAGIDLLIFYGDWRVLNGDQFTVDIT
jgi:hypothetical protein